MPRENTGGKSIRYDVAVSPKLHKAVSRKLKAESINNLSDGVRAALAAWCGDDGLAELPKPGRPKSAKKKAAKKNLKKS